MTGDTNIAAGAAENEDDRALAKAIGHAIFKVDFKNQANDEASRKQVWAENRRSYVKQGRAILNQLRKGGFDISGPKN